MVDVFKATLHKDPRLRLPLGSFNQLLRDRRLWSTRRSPAFGSLAAGVSERVRGVLERDPAADENFAEGPWFEGADFVPWWTGLEPLIAELHLLSESLPR